MERGFIGFATPRYHIGIGLQAALIQRIARPIISFYESSQLRFTLSIAHTSRAQSQHTQRHFEVAAIAQHGVSQDSRLCGLWFGQPKSINLVVEQHIQPYQHIIELHAKHLRTRLHRVEGAIG